MFTIPSRRIFKALALALQTPPPPGLDCPETCRMNLERSTILMGKSTNEMGHLVMTNSLPWKITIFNR